MRLPVFFREKNDRLRRCRLVQLPAQVARDPLADDRHEPQPEVRRPLPDEVHARHHRDRGPRQAQRRRVRQRPRLRAPHHVVEQVAREVRRHEARRRHDRRRAEP
jgi:hypothetical protein